MTWYRAIFDGHVPASFLKDLLRCLFNMYRETEKSCREKYPYPQARDLIGHQRRADIEVQLAHVAARHQQALISVNANRNRSAFHTLVKFEQVMMLQAFTKSSGQMVRRSHFRLVYAALSQVVPRQRDMFSQNFDEVIDISKPLFTMLIHGHNGKDKSRPAFAHIVIPDKAYQMYVEYIDLFRRFPEIVTEFAPQRSTATKKTPDLSIRQDKKPRRNQKRNEP